MPRPPLPPKRAFLIVVRDPARTRMPAPVFLRTEPPEIAASGASTAMPTPFCSTLLFRSEIGTSRLHWTEKPMRMPRTVLLAAVSFGWRPSVAQPIEIPGRPAPPRHVPARVFRSTSTEPPA